MRIGRAVGPGGANQNVSAYTYSLYDRGDTRPGPPPELRFPVSVAVAQVGEATPPDELVDALAADPAAFTKVTGIPGVSGSSQEYVGPHDDGRSATSEQVARMQRLARDVGADDLLIVGGTVDYGAEQTALSVMDLTIIGAYVVPSRDVQAHAKATAAMIDLRTGRVVRTFNAEAHRGVLAPSLAVDEGKARLLQDLRSQVAEELGRRIVADCAGQTPRAKSAAARSREE